MPEVSLSRTITNGCATFTVNNLLIDNESAIDDSNFKIYDVFVELGDGNFMSFFTREVETNERDVVYNSQFTYSYQNEGTYTPVANMKAVYSDDGDPKYPTAPTITTGSDLGAPCPKLVENKLFLPQIKIGPRIARSHMPKFGERNTYIINYQNLINDPDYQNVVVFFYNQKDKVVNENTYTQWNPILDTDELSQFSVSRIAPHVEILAAGTVADLKNANNISKLQNTAASVLLEAQKMIDEFTHYMAFVINPNADNYEQNIFVSLTGHDSMQNALDITPDQDPETLNVAAVHFYRPFQTPNQPVLYAAAVHKTVDDELTRFHDPNEIRVQPKTVKKADIQTEEYMYRIFCSNDGSDVANFVRLKAYIDFAFFDVTDPINDIEVINATFEEKLEVSIVSKQHIAFTWNNIALMGGNGLLDVPQSQLKVSFKLKPKANPAKRKQVTAFAAIEMGVGSIIDTTLTPNRAIIKIKQPTKPTPTPPEGSTDRPSGQNQGCRNLGCSVLFFVGLVAMLWWIF